MSESGDADAGFVQTAEAVGLYARGNPVEQRPALERLEESESKTVIG